MAYAHCKQGARMRTRRQRKSERVNVEKQTLELRRAVTWKSLLINGTEYCSLWHSIEGWLLKGTVVGALKDQPMLANYEIYCDERWVTYRAELECTIGKDTKPLTLSVETHGVWRTSGQELPGLRGCTDIDLAITPATNTLPIRRLDLDIGSSELVVAAWVKFPELTVQPLSQRYTRLARDRYRYESESGFSVEISVDDLGLVTTYPGGWERIAAL
jgi:uncharacterized protein